MKKLTLVVLVFCTSLPAISQSRQTENIILITFDGFRWQGQLYGNRKLDNKVDNANPHWFSYPGYNEILTGYPDPAVNSNDKILNKHETVLEFINKRPAYKGKVAAFTSWDVFDYIINEQRSGVFVSSGIDKLDAKYTPQYKGKTTLIITTDDGRGDIVKKQWRDHGHEVQDAFQIWFGAMGPDTQATGEAKTAGQLYQKQVAATIAKLLGLNYTSNHPVADPIGNVLKK